jgi:hypothetical protein
MAGVDDDGPDRARRRQVERRRRRLQAMWRPPVAESVAAVGAAASGRWPMLSSISVARNVSAGEPRSSEIAGPSTRVPVMNSARGRDRANVEQDSLETNHQAFALARDAMRRGRRDLERQPCVRRLLLEPRG